MNKRICLGVDDGHFGIKTFDDRGKHSIALSRARIGRSTIVNVMGEDAGVVHLKTDGVEYSCGKISNYEQITPENFPSSPLNRVLVHMAIHQHDSGHYVQQAIKKGKEIEIEVCTGLPIGRYFKQGRKNTQLIEEKTQNLSKPVSLVTNDGKEIAISIKPSVTAQTFSAWYDYILTEERLASKPANQPKVIKHDERISESVAFVDLGGGTTDVVVIEDKNFEFSGNPTLSVGSNDVRLFLANALATHFDMEAVSRGMVDDAMTKGIVSLDGKEHDVANLVKEAFNINAEKILAHVKNHIGSKGREVKKLFFIGGAANEFKQVLSGHYRIEEWPSDGQILNARGMYKLLRYIQS